MYDGIKKAQGPVQSKTAPLKSSTGEIITDRGEQMERWVEHYSNLYSIQNIVSPSALDSIICIPSADHGWAGHKADGGWPQQGYC